MNTASIVFNEKGDMLCKGCRNSIPEDYKFLYIATESKDILGPYCSEECWNKIRVCCKCNYYVGTKEVTCKCTPA